jgi:hypothetical protein
VRKDRARFVRVPGEVPFWLIGARRTTGSEWEVVSVEFEKDVAQALQDELKPTARPAPAPPSATTCRETLWTHFARRPFECRRSNFKVDAVQRPGQGATTSPRRLTSAGTAGGPPPSSE